MISRSSHCSSVFAHTNASSLPLLASSSSSSPRFPPRPSPSSSRSSTARSASLSPLSLPSFVSIVPKVPFSSRVSFALPFASLLLASRSSPYYYYYRHSLFFVFVLLFSRTFILFISRGLSTRTSGFQLSISVLIFSPKTPFHLIIKI